MEILFWMFYGLIGLVGLFLLIAYAVSYGIDNSKQVKALSTELRELRKQLKE